MFNEEIGAIKQLERNITINFWEIGKLLKEIEDSGGSLKSVIEDNFSFSYERGNAFKRWYEESLVNPNLDVKTLGIEKTLNVVQPLKEDSGEFLLQHPPEELAKKSVREVRELVSEFKDNKEPDRQKGKMERFFLEAEDDLREVALTFEGIQQRYEEEFKSWDGKDRVFAQLDRLKAVLGVFK